MKVMNLLAAAALVATALTLSDRASAQYYGYDCHAYTACPNGGYVSCRVFGSSSAGVQCSWYVEPYRYVQCTGYDANGYWQKYAFSCY